MKVQTQHFTMAAPVKVNILLKMSGYSSVDGKVIFPQNDLEAILMWHHYLLLVDLEPLVSQQSVLFVQEAREKTHHVFEFNTG